MILFHVSYKIKRIITIFSIYTKKFIDSHLQIEDTEEAGQALVYNKSALCGFYINCLQHITIGDVDLK